MNPWDDLPNGKRIDEVLEFVRDNPDADWDAVWPIVWGNSCIKKWVVAGREAYQADRFFVLSKINDALTLATNRTVLETLWSALRVVCGKQKHIVVPVSAWDVSASACRALVTYDYAGELYDAELDVVELAAHAGDTAAMLLLPMLKAMKEKP